MKQIKVFLDSSVIIAGIDRVHPCIILFKPQASGNARDFEPDNITKQSLTGNFL